MAQTMTTNENYMFLTASGTSLEQAFDNLLKKMNAFAVTGWHPEGSFQQTFNAPLNGFWTVSVLMCNEPEEQEGYEG